MWAVGVNEECPDRDEGVYNACPEGNGCQDWDNPDDFVWGCESEPKETYEYGR